MSVIIENHNNATISITNDMFNNDHIITIDTLHNTISVNGYGGINPTLELRFNKTDALKINKNSISTCNLEMLVYLLADNEDAFCSVYLHIDHFSNYAGYHISRAAFYASFNGDLDSFIDFFTICTPETHQIILADHICYNHDAKMNGIISMSTYVGANKFCQARCQHCNGAICQYCYADSLTAQRANLKNKLARLHAILTSIELSIADIPVLDATIYPYFRFESFGDLNNTIQVNNYNLFASCNPDINFTLWTKNPNIIQTAINGGMVLANNLVIGLSSLYLNTPDIDKAKRYSFIRFLFTVYDDDYIKEHNIVINCGAKHCLSCGICYKYLHEFKHGLQLINERKK